MRVALAVVAMLAPAAGMAAGIGGTWEGSYTCNQGPTGLTLTIAASGDGAARAVFRFYQIDGNPGVPEGCFVMDGTAAGDRLTLAAGRWLYRPPGYVTVDLAGTMSPDGAALAGSIYGPNCTTFALRRVASGAGPATCQPAGVPVS